MFKKGFCLILAVAASALAASPASAQDEMTLNMLAGWDDRSMITPIVADRFTKKVTEATDGRIDFRVSGPEVVAPREQFQPTSAGAFDVLFTTPVYYLGTTGVTMAFFALPPDSELWRERGYWDYADQEFQRFDQKLISLITGSSKSNYYQIVLKEPLKDGAKPFDGMKIRGNIFYKPLVAPLGGSLVNLDAGEIYSSLEKGVVDGAAWPVLGAVNFKFHEVAGYMTRPRFGRSPFTITMNLDAFNELSEADQELMLEIGREIEREVTPVFEAEMEKEIEQLKELGVQETHLDQSVFEEVNKGFLEGVWNIAVNFNEETKERAQKLYDMAKENGDAE